MGGPGGGAKIVSLGTETSTTASPRVLLIAVPLAIAIIAAGFWTFTRESPPVRQPDEPVATSPLAAVAIQAQDLPKGFRRCSYSGPMEAYLDRLRRVNQATYLQVQSVWDRLRAQRATDAYVAYWADSDAACDVVLHQDAVGPDVHALHATTVFSVVVEFPDRESAVSAYRADMFEQSKLKASTTFHIRDGDASGLGPNAIVATTPQSGPPIHQAAWQNGSMNVLYGSENLALGASEDVTAAINRRIG